MKKGYVVAREGEAQVCEHTGEKGGGGAGLWVHGREGRGRAMHRREGRGGGGHAQERREGGGRFVGARKRRERKQVCE